MESDNQNNHSTTPATTPRLVQRRTGLRGLSIGAAPVPHATIRKQTMALLNERDPEIPYVKFEKVLRDLVCSLMERQDWMNEELLRRMIDLQYRMDDLEMDLEGLKEKNPAGSTEITT